MAGKIFYPYNSAKDGVLGRKGLRVSLDVLMERLNRYLYW
jgi:hypothetical protein